MSMPGVAQPAVEQGRHQVAHETTAGLAHEGVARGEGVARTALKQGVVLDDPDNSWTSEV
jgi:hypothetical protein